MIGDSDFLASSLHVEDSYLRICFLPNNCASTENAPGPIIARVAPKVAMRIVIPASPWYARPAHTSTAATRAPAKGVHNPIMTKIASTAPIACGDVAAVRCCPLNNTPASWSSAIPATRRWTSSPQPGQPLANVVKSLCKDPTTEQATAV